MLIASPQINNVNLVPKSNDLQGIEGQSSGGSGSFISVLASMMNDGGMGFKSLKSELSSQGNPLDAMLKQMQELDGFIDPLMMSFIQQLMANPQQFQDAFTGNIVAADNNIHLIAQLNNGQFQDLTEFVKNLLSNQDVNMPLTQESIRQAVIDNFNKKNFKEELTLANELKQLIASKDTALTENIDFAETVTKSITASQGVSEELIIQPEKTLIDNNLENNLIDALKVKNDKTTENNAIFDKKALIAEANNKLSSLHESDAITAKALNEELSVLFKDDITVDEVQFGSSAKLTNDINSADVSSTRLESPQVTATNNTHHNAHTKTDASVKETVHVSRLQEIDTKMFKAIETGQKSLTVRLEPPELGSVHIKLVLTDGMIRADMKVDNIAVKEMMNLALPQIKNSLENAGIKVSEFFVDIREEYYSDGRQNQKDNNDSKNHKHQKQNQEKDFKPFEFYI